MAGKVWSQSEIDYLVENYETLSYKEIAKNLDKPLQSIKQKRLQLNLKKKSEQGTLLEAFGEFKTLKEWSLDSRCQTSYKNLFFRINQLGMSLEEAISKPLQIGETRVKMKVGEKINRLTLKETYKKDDCGVMCTYGIFECECGKKDIHIKVSNVVREHTRSCSCYSTEKLIERSKTHGKSKSVEYYAYNGMKDRCYNINCDHYESWGGRGIRMCDRWLESFENFYEDMGPRPPDKTELDRMDENYHYCKENCRWATREEGLISKENNRQIVAFGEIKSVLHWTRDVRCKATIDTVKYRLWKLGWDTEKSIETVEYLG